MLDFSQFRRKAITFADLVDGLTVQDLRNSTNAMIDHQLDLLDGCINEDVTFLPVDNDALDLYADRIENANLAWTLGHVIVHVTASSEETAFLAAEMARGVIREGRSRYETPWENLSTIAQCRQRLEESRRMRLATLEVWPDNPHLDQTIIYGRMPQPINAVGRFVFGLLHDYDHLEQIEAIVRQAHALREVGY
ncbi:MAG: DinB family protein [Chloroflexota bacterium]|jgi:hypothetical protein